jgi:hypothetical protein
LRRGPFNDALLLKGLKPATPIAGFVFPPPFSVFLFLRIGRPVSDYRPTRTHPSCQWTCYATRVATARRKYSIPGQRTAPKRPDVLTQAQAAKYCNVSQHTIQRMVETSFLVNHQEVPLAPWEIMKADIDSPKIKAVLNHLKQTGELITKGDHLGRQLSLGPTNKGDDNGGYYE